MKQNLFPEGMPAKDRRDNLQAMAHSIENTSYYVDLTQDELDVRREQLTDNFIKVAELEAELKRTTKLLKAEQKPLVEENASLMQAIKTKSEEKSGVLYHVDNQEEGMMHSYDQDGYLVSSRRLRPDEKQSSIFSIAQNQ